MPKAEMIDAIIAAIDVSPIATVVTDNRVADNPIIAANDAFYRMTGYGPEEVIGSNCRFLAGASSEPEARSTIRQAVTDGRAAVAELWNYRKDGSPFRNAIMVAPIRDSSGETAFFLGTQMEVQSQTPQGFGLNQARRRVLALTPRQRQVLKLMANGYRDGQIGDWLGIGDSAVKRLRGRLLQKLGVPTVIDAVRIGIEAGLASEDGNRTASGTPQRQNAKQGNGRKRSSTTSSS